MASKQTTCVCACVRACMCLSLSVYPEAIHLHDITDIDPILPVKQVLYILKCYKVILLMAVALETKNVIEKFVCIRVVHIEG